jgi:putative peptide zinc metalloprotease protein
MLLLFTPLPYVDLSSSWTFRDRFKRAWVGSAGMVTDFFVGAVATIVWAYSPPGLVNELAYNLMFSTAIYTLLFNINPLMRFDGYYVFADLIGIPNLHEAAI